MFSLADVLGGGIIGIVGLSLEVSKSEKGKGCVDVWGGELGLTYGGLGLERGETSELEDAGLHLGVGGERVVGL